MSEHSHDVEELSLSPEPGRIRVTVAGALNVITGAKLEVTVTQLFDNGLGHIVLDLRRLSSIDTHGLHVLLNLHERAAAREVQFDLVARPDNIALLLHRAGLSAWH